MDLSEARGGFARRHPWEVARAKFFRKLLREQGLVDTPRTAIDIGAGDGYIAKTLFAELAAGSRMVCYDVNYTDADLDNYARPAIDGLTFVRQRPSGRFDLMLFLDVLEHVADDHAFLKEMVGEALAPGGTIVVSVPAWQGLFGTHDEALKHYRRYSPRTLRATLSNAGLEVTKSGGIFHTLLLSRAITVAGERMRRWIGREPIRPPNLGEWQGNAMISAVIDGVLFLDNGLSLLLSRFGYRPAGLTIWAVASGRR